MNIVDTQREFTVLYLSEVITKGNLDLIDTIIHEDYLPSRASSEFGGRNVLKRRISLWRYSFSTKYELSDIRVSKNCVSYLVKATIKQIRRWHSLEVKDGIAVMKNRIRFEFLDDKINKITGMPTASDIIVKIGHSPYTISKQWDEFDRKVHNPKLVVCGWCQKVLEVDYNDGSSGLVSHGICKSCSREYF